MKNYIKLIAIILMLAMAAASVACAKAGTENVTAEPAETAAATGESTAPVDITGPYAGNEPEAEYEAEFYRISYSYGSEQSKLPVVITSVSEFNANVLPNIPEADRRAAAQKYGEEFFKSNRLVMFFVIYGSGSVQPKVTSVEKADGTVTVMVEGVMEGDVGTCDMAAHMGLVSLANSFCGDDCSIEIAAGKANAGSAKTE